MALKSISIFLLEGRRAYVGVHLCFNLFVEDYVLTHHVVNILDLWQTKPEQLSNHSIRVPCHFRLRSAVDHAKLCTSMKMEVPGLADSLQQCLCVNSGIYAGNVLDTDPGWQQSKLIWALSAEVGLASRMHCTSLWHVKAARQPFVCVSIAF